MNTTHSIETEDNISYNHLLSLQGKALMDEIVKEAEIYHFTHNIPGIDTLPPKTSTREQTATTSKKFLLKILDKLGTVLHRTAPKSVNDREKINEVDRLFIAQDILCTVMLDRLDNYDRSQTDEYKKQVMACQWIESEGEDSLFFRTSCRMPDNKKYRDTLQIIDTERDQLLDPHHTEVDLLTEFLLTVPTNIIVHIQKEAEKFRAERTQSFRDTGKEYFSSFISQKNQAARQ